MGRSRLLIAVAVCGAGALLAAVPTAASATGPIAVQTRVAPSEAPVPVWVACTKWVPAGARCGYLKVAEDPLRPELGKQKVGFEFYKRHDPSTPSAGTLVGQEGGPGYPTTGSRDWYLGLFAPMRAHHDVLLVDERGTGSSGAINCKPLQHGTLPYEKAVAACGEQLGERADTYVTAYGADDMAHVLDALHIDQIDLYGDSYGTFFSQVFAIRHPDRVRTLVLDASYPVVDQDPWYRDTNRAIQDAIRRVCDRDPSCASRPGTALHRLAAAGQELHAHPITGRAPNADGKTVTVHLNAADLALATANATYGTTIYRELDAAVRAYRHGHSKPLMRIVAENLLLGNDNGPVADYSAGEYVAVICNDYPQLWDTSLPPGAQRHTQYRHAVQTLDETEPRAFYPFRNDDWIKAGWGEPHTCIGWPSPTDQLLPKDPSTPFPAVPTLVLSGDLDTVTSPEGGRTVAQEFGATFVAVPNVGHVTALGDYQGCAAGIVRHFIRTGGQVGGTSCVDDAYAPVRTVQRFAVWSAGMEPARQGLAVRTSRSDRLVVGSTVAAVGDVFSRWWVNYSGAGAGLRGGTFSYTGDAHTMFRLKGYRFTRDVAVTGKVQWDRTTGHVRADLVVNGPKNRDGRLTITYDDWKAAAQAHVTGHLGGHPVNLRTAAG